MLSKEDKEKIFQLRAKDLSYDAIHEKTGYATNTIMKICKEEEERIKEAERAKVEGSQEISQTQEMHFDSAVQKVREIEAGLEGILASEELKAGDREEWNTRLADIQGLLRIEIDDRIASEMAETIKKRDKEWRVFLEKDYVKKEIATNLETTIGDLKKIIEERNATIGSLGQENKNFVSQNQHLQNENLALAEKNGELSSYIEDFLENAGRREKEECIKQRELLGQERASFDEHTKRKEKILKDWHDEQDGREKELDALQEQIKQSIDEDKQTLAENKQTLAENKQTLDEKKQVLQKIEEGRQKIKGEMENLRQERKDLNITKEDLLEIREKASERKIHDRLISIS